jgi:hypothetical protein
MDIPELESKIENLKSKLLESNRLLSEAPQGSPSKSDLEENLQLKRTIAELEQRKTTIKESIAGSATAGAFGSPKSPIQHVATLLSSGFDSIRTSLPGISIGKGFGSGSGNAQPPSMPTPAPVPVRVEEQSEDIFSEERVSSASASASMQPQAEQTQIPLIEGAPNIGPHILPSDKPGTDFAAARMINALQTNLAPKSVIEQLQNPVAATSAAAATAATKPAAPHKVRVVFKARLAKPVGEGEQGEAAAAIVVNDQRPQKLVSRDSIVKNLKCELPICLAEPIEPQKETKLKSKSKLMPLALALPSALGTKATPQQPVAVLRQVVIIKKLPKHIYLEEDPSLLLESGESGAAVAATPARVTASRKGRVFEKPEFGIMTQDMQDLQIGDQIVRERLPRVPPLGIRASTYYMNNREKFVNFINQLFMTYHAEVADQKETISCDPEKNKEFSLLTHQKIVRDYLNIYTPYRGLLLYHGLGSGKTCSSIAIAEGLKTHKKVIVMTPASLQRNYVEELKKCGDDIYKKNQYWEFIGIQSKVDPMVETLSAILSLPKQFIVDQTGAWLVNIKKSSNYTSLNAGERESLDSQLNKMISAKYQFINYNGMRMSHLNTLTSNFTENPFNDRVVIIDEAHNFISRIVNKLRRPTSLSMRLYELLMTAQNVKIILLSGTPVINYPNEVAIIFNILRGYIKVWKIPLQVGAGGGPQSKIDKKVLDQLFSSLEILDYMDYNDTSHVLTITRNPFGFVNVNERGEYMGVGLGEGSSSGSGSSAPGEMPQLSDTDFERMVLTTLKSRNINVVAGSITIETYKALPDSLDSFRSYFIDAQSGNVKNIRMFQRRILGLASYFRSAQEQLMPAYDKATHFRVIEIPMSTHQFAAYEEARRAERKLEKNARTKKRLGSGSGAGAAGKSRPGAGGGGDDIYEDAVSSYRIFSRLFCNFVFPTEITRPLPKEGTNVEGAVNDGTNEEDVDALTAAERIDNMNGEHAGDDAEEIVKEIEQKVDSSYEKRIATALMRIRSGMAQYLTKAPQGELQTYSPKFLAMLENITEPQHYGLHLVYSQFRTIEGIGLFAMVLEANGFARFKIRKNDSSAWVLDVSDADQGKPMYALYTGTESDEEREIIRNVFNSTWDYIPVTLKQQLMPKSANNFMGEIVKVLMITASGAEGISLRNVRYVHIMEPYWQPVRIEQVIGRARRICSHNDLKDEKLRSVYVMMYIMRFTPEQMADDASMELRLNDVSKLNAQKPITTDQALFEISTIKEEINSQLLMAIKEASIDCAIHRDKNSKEKLKCFTFGSVMSNKFSYPPSVDNEESDTSASRNVKQTTLKLNEITASVDGKPVKYAYDKSTKLVYDLGSYIVSQEVGGEPLCIGKLEVNQSGKAKLVPLSEIEKETGAVPVQASSSKLPTASSRTGGVAASKRSSGEP